MSEPKKKKLTGQQAELMRALDITPEDIEANDAGYITEHQRKTIVGRQMYRWLPFLIPAGIFLLMPPIYLFIILAEPEAAVPLLFTSLGFWAAAAGFGIAVFWQWRNLQKDLARGEVRSAQGIAVVNVNHAKNTYNSSLEIGDLKLKASPKVLLRVRHLEPYVVNYLPESKVIVSMQHVDEDQNIRQDEAASRLVDVISATSSYSEDDNLKQQSSQQ